MILRAKITAAFFILGFPSVVGFFYFLYLVGLIFHFKSGAKASCNSDPCYHGLSTYLMQGFLLLCPSIFFALTAFFLSKQKRPLGQWLVVAAALFPIHWTIFYAILAVLDVAGVE